LDEQEAIKWRTVLVVSDLLAQSRLTPEMKTHLTSALTRRRW
jgi:hypothetical protein